MAKIKQYDVFFGVETDGGKRALKGALKLALENIGAKQIGKLCIDQVDDESCCKNDEEAVF